MLRLKGKNDYIFEVPKVGSPITILQGKVIKLAAQLTARYSDNKERTVLVKYGKGKLNKEIKINQLTEEGIEGLRL